ncbi:MAG: hypothetical protein ACRCYP_02155 [Alphaproteobacteria bacterium]
MENDDNYKRLVVLGTAMEDRGWDAVHIRDSIGIEMLYHYRDTNAKNWWKMPYCIEREIRDAYPPEKQSKMGRRLLKIK